MNKIKEVKVTQYEYNDILYDTAEAAKKAEQITKLSDILDENWFHGCVPADIVADLYDEGVRVSE